MDRFEEKVRLYRQRVAAFMVQAHVWCTARGLVVDTIPTELFEEAIPKYEATSLRILTPDRQPLAELLPTGAAIIGAHGRIDLRGDLARHAFLFQTGSVSAISQAAKLADATTSDDTSQPILSGIDGDGWYWHEAFVRRAKRVDESLFLDLLTDVSDYEFQ